MERLLLPDIRNQQALDRPHAAQIGAIIHRLVHQSRKFQRWAAPSIPDGRSVGREELIVR
jgi:hypothetical protein